LRAAVLAGGLGTRLRPYTTILPKPLVPVGDRPILELIFAWLAESEVERVDVCIGHLGELIQTYFSQAKAIPSRLDVHWQWELEPLGTAGALRSIPDVQESLLVVNGDILTDLDPRELVEFHRSEGAALTIAAREAEIETDLGVLVQEGSTVVGYHEKPTVKYTASVGVYVYEPSVLASLPDGPLQFPELVLRLLASGEHVVAFPTTAAWSHIGTVEQHEEASRSLSALPEEPRSGADVQAASRARRSVRH
jgi:NDP-sugar pyrophosphorylase family protein